MQWRRSRIGGYPVREVAERLGVQHEVNLHDAAAVFAAGLHATVAVNRARITPFPTVVGSKLFAAFARIFISDDHRKRSAGFSNFRISVSRSRACLPGMTARNRANCSRHRPISGIGYCVRTKLNSVSSDRRILRTVFQKTGSSSTIFLPTSDAYKRPAGPGQSYPPTASPAPAAASQRTV